MTEPHGEPRRQPPPEPVETLIATPKSSVWQGLLGSAWVVASSIMLEVVAKLLEGAVGENEVVTRVVGALRWIVVAVVVLAALYLVWSRVAEMRERVRRARELDLTATLVEPATPVPLRLEPMPFRGPGQRPSLTFEDVVVAAALRELSLPDYESAALYDVVGAMLAAADLLPADRRRAEDDRPTADAVIRRLMAHDILVHRTDDRFAALRRRAEPAAAEATRRTADVFRVADVPHDHPEPTAAERVWRRAARQAMVPALLRHYADRVQRWVIALDSARLGTGARRWFTDEWPRLAELVRACAPETATDATASGASEKCGLPDDLRATVDVGALARIADALDLWYADNGWPEHTDGVAAAVRAVLDSPLGDTHPELRALARIRAGDPGRPVRRYRPRRYSTSLQARRAHRLALRRLEHPEEAEPARVPESAVERRLEAAEHWIAARLGPKRKAHQDLSVDEQSRPGLAEVVDQLEKAWWWLPRADVAGEVCALIDLAVVHLRQGRLVAARNRLELAESLTRGGRDPSGRAHTFEMMGVLWWVRGEPRRALRFWQVALTRYDELNHRLGVARCLQHLGSAMAVAPEYGSLLLDGDIDTSEVLRQASGWLAEAAALHPDALFATTYRAAVCEQLRAIDLTPLDRAERWPLPVADGGEAVVALS
ncbi:hypothetical protein [Nocardia blacklockiae]|uniref:hypothetical protein n=1 Tax=Nocardia blacklockiae TaxID=480036 RepID=UPI001894C719|nr:hypothetical protein [Nocardia blacklockiae]MBF6170895.1 hypothetical protein [Nocardia blacklockiae]